MKIEDFKETLFCSDDVFHALIKESYSMAERETLIDEAGFFVIDRIRIVRDYRLPPNSLGTGDPEMIARLKEKEQDDE